ncbi:hypothetical protein AGABI1DRAFT_71424 [Agaricus bisporus var. burnettii JB137-S8]|uniref:DNA repair and recombination protein RAD54B n=1 Tax=Agaricus bisporus var. burnettii (strain JB137-S8 / ATCC MYA-4627 / FGSC 10392) TaxID=597362 RepID=K5XC14_AGABU|nr:uncharacterized protein AGABI1DRAFT_71424 [Agaricus bisporus var. burnettii JB137-S8]EKM80843.1 hypothetical protein AGABI1DRAFT_71424 [Agaricus bisporus var. burnettii JB137-S8]
MNPLKRGADGEDPAWTSRKRPSLVPEKQEYWMITWRNPQTRKHKTWDGDAVLCISGRKATIYDTDGKQMSVGCIDGILEEGRECFVGGKEIELDRQISEDDYNSGRCFGVGTSNSISEISPAVRMKSKFVPPTSRKPLIPLVERKVTIPLQPVNLASSSNTVVKIDQEPENDTSPSYWTANWQSKAHKTWDGDAYVACEDGKLTMFNENGKMVGFTVIRSQQPHSGLVTYIGGKEVQLDCRIPQSQFPGFEQEGSNEATKLETITELVKNTVNVSSFYGISKPKVSGPLHDPNAEGALVMKKPTSTHSEKLKMKPIIPVVVDPILTRRMRDHQREGVKFLYECVMGLSKHEGQGCILADEMGLGKTLQTIALVWTLLKQNPYLGAGPVVKKVMIVCPVSLMNNWRSEFYKWLGRDRVGIATYSKDPIELHGFKNSSTHPILIIGYERLRSMVPQIDLIICDEGHRLKSSQTKTNQMFKDFKTRRRIILSGTPIQNDLSEFHAMTEFCNPGLLDDYPKFRSFYEVPILKSRSPDASTKEIEIGEARTSQLLVVAKSYVLRRDANLLNNYLPPKHEYVVFISPTPLQLQIFRKILTSDREDDIIEQNTTAEALALIGIFTKISNSPILLKAMAANAEGKENSIFQKRNVADATKLVPVGAQIEDMSLSGKLIALSNILKVVHETTEEKCVLVSHYTSTLNILEAFCRKKQYSYFRLDGQTPQAQRQGYVNSFNRSNQRNGFIFLLSSKAGGVGINLIGASRLFLVDSDWNPSHDIQSMARCHRDGQKRPVFIYRLLTAGAIDEKIYQRQMTKLALSDSLIGGTANASKSDTFTKRDLQDIFRIHVNTPSNTHDLLECPCHEGHSYVATDHSTSIRKGSAEDPGINRGFVNATQVTSDYVNKLDKANLAKKEAALVVLKNWSHVNCLAASARDLVQDDILRQVLSIQEVPGGTITFVFKKTSKSTQNEDE